jgi:excisionase family DNA binding protein
MDEILSTTEVARYFKVNHSTVWRWCSQGRLPAFKVGSRWRVYRSDLEKFVGRNIRQIISIEAKAKR